MVLDWGIFLTEESILQSFLAAVVSILTTWLWGRLGAAGLMQRQVEVQAVSFHFVSSWLISHFKSPVITCGLLQWWAVWLGVRKYKCTNHSVPESLYCYENVSQWVTQIERDPCTKSHKEWAGKLLCRLYYQCLVQWGLLSYSYSHSQSNSIDIYRKDIFATLTTCCQLWKKLWLMKE